MLGFLDNSDSVVAIFVYKGGVEVAMKCSHIVLRRLNIKFSYTNRSIQDDSLNGGHFLLVTTSMRRVKI